MACVSQSVPAIAGSLIRLYTSVQGQYVAAITCYNEALALDPENFKALFNRGFSWDKAGDHEAAIADYTAATEVDPQNSFAYYNRYLNLTLCHSELDVCCILVLV